MLNDSSSISDTSIQLRQLLSVIMAEILSCDLGETLRLLKREDLSMPRIAALNIVEQQGSASISEVSAYLGLSLGNTSILIDKLVCHECVSRVEDQNDRRHKLVRLTAKGQALIAELRATHVDHVMQHIELLPPELQDRVIAVLRDIFEHLPQHNLESIVEHPSLGPSYTQD